MLLASAANGGINTAALFIERQRQTVKSDDRNRVPVDSEFTIICIHSDIWPKFFSSCFIVLLFSYHREAEELWTGWSETRSGMQIGMGGMCAQ